MNRISKSLTFAGVIIALLALIAVPTFAQDVTPMPAPVTSDAYPTNSITVIGTGAVHAAPDVAAVDVGVDVFKPTVSDAFAQANATLQDIIDALTTIGVAPEDIQTSNLSVYMTSQFNAEKGSDEQGYTVSNTVHVIVRDVTQVEAVIDAAINAGATNLYGLSFDIQDRTALETQARGQAMQDAAARAQEYADLIGAQLGGVIVITENSFGNVQPPDFGIRSDIDAQSAVVAPGQSEIQIQTTVTYRIVR